MAKKAENRKFGVRELGQVFYRWKYSPYFGDTQIPSQHSVLSVGKAEDSLCAANQFDQLFSSDVINTDTYKNF